MIGAGKDAPRSVPLTLAIGWRSSALWLFGFVGLAVVAWGMTHVNQLVPYVLQAGDVDVRRQQLHARTTLGWMALGALLPGVGMCLRNLRRIQQGAAPFPVALPTLAIACAPLPLFGVPGFEFQHPFLSGVFVVFFSLAAAHSLPLLAPRAWAHLLATSGDLSPRGAMTAVLLGWAIFTASMGFLAHWRFITFHAELYDTSWETNAVFGIVEHGVPSISCGAGDFYFEGQRLPVTYFDTHVPLVYYLYAPFYALFRDSRTLLWLQALHMGSGCVGMYLFARRWLGKRWLGVAMALVYLLHPSVQGHCLHDLHANSLAIPSLLLALGFMEAGHIRWAVAWALVTALCREETPLYAACIGLFWALGSRNHTRMKVGWIVLGLSGASLLFITQWLMPHFGGKPRWTHFSFYFDTGSGVGSVLKAFVLNPVGGLVQATLPYKLEFFWLSFLPFGLLACRGLRGGWFALAALALLVPTEHRDFFAAGMNYSAPIVPAVMVMSVFGIRRCILSTQREEGVRTGRRYIVALFVIGCALFSNYLYGNIAAKSYKLEYGMWPYRRTVAYNYENQIGYMPRLPPFGERERLLWDLIAHVPPKVPIATSWSINPQLSSRDISLHYPFMGQGHQPEARPNYVVLDKLPPLMDRSPERDIEELRANPEWRVFYENEWGVIFERVAR